jgi:hypothetical protein
MTGSIVHNVTVDLEKCPLLSEDSQRQITSTFEGYQER